MSKGYEQFLEKEEMAFKCMKMCHHTVRKTQMPVNTLLVEIQSSVTSIDNSALYNNLALCVKIFLQVFTLHM